MIVFGYPQQASERTKIVFNLGVLYLMDGPIPTKVPDKLASLEGGEQVYNDCVGFLQVSTTLPADRPKSVTFAEYINTPFPEITTKGWHEYEGNMYCIPDSVEVGGDTVNYINYHNAGLNSVIPVSYGSTGNGAEHKETIHKFKTPITVNTIKKGTTSTNATFLYYKDGNDDWVEVTSLNSSAKDTSFPDVTSTEFKLQVQTNEYGAIHFMLGNTNATPSNPATVRNVTHGILVSVSSFTEVQNWTTYTGSNIPGMLFSVGKPGDLEPLILNKLDFKEGERISLQSLDLTFQELGDDNI